MNAARYPTPELMRGLLGDDNFRDVENIARTLTDLERRGAITPEWHTHIINEIADEVIAQQIANDVTREALTAEAPTPDTPTPCGHSSCASSTHSEC